MGKIYLVGGGPGDPELITLKGLRLIKSADVIIYDRLVSDELLRCAKPGAEVIYVGKSKFNKVMGQEEINKLLIAKAKENKMVIRLKGGDPMILGRGGEELEALAEEGIPFEIVPGITSAIAAPSYAGIPLTHRNLSSSVAILTGHQAGEDGLDWSALARIDTLVILMGLENLGEITSNLLRKGRHPQTPVALIQWGSSGRQRVVVGNLKDIYAKSKEAGLTPPVVIVVGEVVRLRGKLSWFERKPLFGKRILVTRAPHQTEEISVLLREYGAEPVLLPSINIQPLFANLSSVNINEFDWLVFTSANGVWSFLSYLRSKGRDARALAGLKICAIGPGTGEELSRYGLLAEVIPKNHSTEGVANELERFLTPGERVLLIRSDLAGNRLVFRLSKLGVKVVQVAAYAIRYAELDPSKLKDISVVTFTSPSTVRGLLYGLGGSWEKVKGALVACIGPVTAQACWELGLKADIISEEHTIPGLVRSLVSYYS